MMMRLINSLLTVKEPSPDRLIERARGIWRICLLFPFLYLILAKIIEVAVFNKHYPAGLVPVKDSTFTVILAVLAIFAAASELALVMIQRAFNAKIREMRLIPIQAAMLYGRRTVFMILCADTVSLLGLCAFLIRAEYIPLIIFCAASYILYAQSYPRGRHLE